MTRDRIVRAEEAVKLRAMVDALVAGSTLEPGQSIAAGANRTGQTILFPGVNSLERSTYPAFWTRDPAWIAAAGLIDPDVTWGWLRLLCGTMNGAETRRLESGGVLPPFAVADHINLDGRPVYYPGTYDSGESQGPPWGKYPPHDDQYWVTFTAHAYLKTSGDTDAGTRTIATPIGEIPVWLACDLTHHAFNVNPDTGLCHADESREEHIVDWGYNDTITKTGNLLFPSLLRLESCIKLVEILEGSGQYGRASAIRAQAETLRKSIQETFVETFDRDGETETWLVSATGTGRLPDVWGTALAIHRGFVDGDLTDALTRSLLRAFRTGTAVLEGQIRHVPTNFGDWPVAQAPAGTYQNGGYWGYPTGWYINALSRIDEGASRELFVSFLSAMERNWNDDGVECAWECVNPAVDHFQNPGYLTTVALPYVALIESGLLPPQ